ncbi:hypothetical protein V8G54_010630 [Vigna mungo]|uniref:Uncharacterized protein n=1 Tax=Vigna mungo TaxID=3915 RepID=A0AAQ3P0F4_VIGMU
MFQKPICCKHDFILERHVPLYQPHISQFYPISRIRAEQQLHAALISSNSICPISRIGAKLRQILPSFSAPNLSKIHPVQQTGVKLSPHGQVQLGNFPSATIPTTNDPIDPICPNFLQYQETQ